MLPNSGRTKRYSRKKRERLAELVRMHGSRRTRELLQRSISCATLLRIAREFGIELKKGRRAVQGTQL